MKVGTKKKEKWNEGKEDTVVKFDNIKVLHMFDKLV
jgi:hypothetical protein